jgi:hypothetical protein
MCFGCSSEDNSLEDARAEANMAPVEGVAVLAPLAAIGPAVVARLDSAAAADDIVSAVCDGLRHAAPMRKTMVSSFELLATV